MPRQPQTVSPNRPLTVEIPTGLDAAIASSGDTVAATVTCAAAATTVTEADIKLGERTAFIPMTCQEKQLLDRLETSLDQASALWRDCPEQHEQDQLLASALHQWSASGSVGSNASWMWEVGRWGSQYSLPFALELRRLDPEAMQSADQLVAQTTCLRNRQLELSNARQQRQSTATTVASTADDNKKRSRKGGSAGSGDEDAAADEEEAAPCLCQIRWGLAPDTEAAKRRQLEKKLLLDEERQQVSPPLAQQQQQQLRRRRTSPPLQRQHPHPRYPASCQQPQQQQHQAPLRPIVKTSHLRDQVQSCGAEDPGYGSQGSSPLQQQQHQQHQQYVQQYLGDCGVYRGGQVASPLTSPCTTTYIGDLLANSCRGGRGGWMD